MAYKIVRFYEDESKPKTIIKRGLSLEEAKKWCNDPETSSKTASKPKGCAGDEAQIARWHEKQKHWFDGFTQE